MSDQQVEGAEIDSLPSPPPAVAADTDTTGNKATTTTTTLSSDSAGSSTGDNSDTGHIALPPRDSGHRCVCVARCHVHYVPRPLLPAPDH